MVELHQKSKQYIVNTFERYTEDFFTDGMIIDRPVIHMYAKEDTIDSYGQLNVYIDALHCEVHVYDVVNGKKYKTRRLHDGVNVYNAKMRSVKVFKDGSTMLTTYGKHRIECNQALEISHI